MTLNMSPLHRSQGSVMSCRDKSCVKKAPLIFPKALGQMYKHCYFTIPLTKNKKKSSLDISQSEGLKGFQYKEILM